MIKSRTKTFLVFCLIVLSFSFVIWPFGLEAKALNIKQNDALIERISRDFSKKFCNGVGFGLSQESAIEFAMKENIAVFKNKKGIENIDTKDIAEKVSISVDDKCGYSLTVSEDQWKKAFKKGDLNLSEINK